jgi:hypothetical protein
MKIIDAFLLLRAPAGRDRGSQPGIAAHNHRLVTSEHHGFVAFRQSRINVLDMSHSLKLKLTVDEGWESNVV